MRAVACALVLAACARHTAVRPAAEAPREPREEPRLRWQWRLPPGFPVPLVPPDNPMSAEKVRLGRYLFHDTRLSGNSTYACASCHRQRLAFTDGRPRAVGSTGEPHPRGTMSLANVAYNASLNWADPRTRRLEEQALVPLLGRAPVELGLAGREAEVLGRFGEDPAFVRMFGEAFPADADPITLSNAVRAIASFVRTIVSGDSPYDRLVYRGESDALDDSARRGMRLFFSERLRCSSCHAGFTFSGPVVFEGEDPVEPVFHNTGLYDLDGRGAYPAENPGAWAVTGRPEDMGRFRAPTLRNVAVTAPYMHDGTLADLGAVIDFYAAGGRGAGRANPLKSERIAGFALAPGERDDLLRFLESLTDPAFLTDPALGDPGAR